MIDLTNSKQLIVLDFEDLQKVLYDCIKQIMFEQSEPKQEEEKYLTTEDVISLFHCNRSTLWRWHKDGVLPCTKIGKTNLYKESIVKSLLQNHEK